MLRALQGKLQIDSVRIFLTAWLVYAVFWNPWLQSSMTFNFLDTAVSFVDTGRWAVAHPQLYKWFDTATLPGRVVSAEPPGVAVLLLPFYWGWRSLFGLVDTVETFQQFNGAVALMVGATASAFVAVQAAWLAGWLGAERCGRCGRLSWWPLERRAFISARLCIKRTLPHVP